MATRPGSTFAGSPPTLTTFRVDDDPPNRQGKRYGVRKDLSRLLAPARRGFHTRNPLETQRCHGPTIPEIQQIANEGRAAQVSAALDYRSDHCVDAAKLVHN